MRRLLLILLLLCLGATLPPPDAPGYIHISLPRYDAPVGWTYDILSCPSRSLPTNWVSLATEAAVNMHLPLGVVSITNSVWNLLTPCQWVLPPASTWQVITNIPTTDDRVAMLPSTNDWGTFYMVRLVSPFHCGPTSGVQTNLTSALAETQ